MIAKVRVSPEAAMSLCRLLRARFDWVIAVPVTRFSHFPHVGRASIGAPIARLG